MDAESWRESVCGTRTCSSSGLTLLETDVTFCLDKLQKWLLFVSDRVPIDLQDFMYCYGVRAGSGKSWLFAIERYAKATNLLQSLRLAKSLACVDDGDIINM